ncbi:gas vesicle protein [Nocardioides guangzhouensis]|uniref:Gas vesicle protein n=1 Tax=Nocardioides guangzhouensis TaxID=2497878 RepID=A0A4Q4Z796_9ACTN|nr:gas vesicle protein [Nocardioides guangzhouensis]RYP83633.1 gas vesicle protein [Nocardioides guangzhouensis]
MTVTEPARATGVEPVGSGPGGQIALVDLLDRLLGTGVVLAGDVVISLAGVDLVQVRLHALITSVRSEMGAGMRVGDDCDL